MIRFEAFQGPYMGQTQLYSSLALCFLYYTTVVHGIGKQDAHILPDDAMFGNQNTQVISLAKDGLTLRNNNSRRQTLFIERKVTNMEAAEIYSLRLHFNN